MLHRRAPTVSLACALVSLIVQVYIRMGGQVSAHNGVFPLCRLLVIVRFL